MKASSNVPKTYVVKVAGQPDDGKLEKLRMGVSIAEKGGRRVRTAPAKIRLIREGDNPWLEVTIIEGRNRQVRKMFEEVGHHVEKIRRVRYGPLSLDVPPGEFRSLTLEEVSRLKAASSGKIAPAARPEILPNERPRGMKPSKNIANRRAEAPRHSTTHTHGQVGTAGRRHPKARAPRPTKPEGLRYRKANAQDHRKSEALRHSKTHSHGQLGTAGPRHPKARAPRPAKPEGLRYPKANAQGHHKSEALRHSKTPAQGQTETEGLRRPKTMPHSKPQRHPKSPGNFKSQRRPRSGFSSRG
jgi:23S rRNA pseudouridine2605 synthase